jgi:hypothetical protein
MTATISLIIAVIALGISGTTLWLAFLRRGALKMTLPTVIYFGADGGREPGLKVYFRALLYSTAKRGWIVEGMYVRIRRGETSQNLNVWILGEDKALVRGSGLFVGEVGVATNHHFLPPADGTDFKFIPGNYTVEIYVTCVADNAPRLLRTIQLVVTAEHAAAIRSAENGLYYDWGPDANAYHAHIRRRPEAKPPE